MHDRRRPITIAHLEPASVLYSQRICIRLYESILSRLEPALRAKFQFLVSLCSWQDFESHFVGNPEDPFCRVEGQLYDKEQNMKIAVDIKFC